MSNVCFVQMDPDTRRRRILVDIVNAGVALENEIVKYNEHIDEELLNLLYRRIETSSMFGKVRKWLRSPLEVVPWQITKQLKFWKFVSSWVGTRRVEVSPFGMLACSRLEANFFLMMQYRNLRWKG